MENSTYLTLSSTNTFNSDDQTCIYTICSMSPKICRIRFDFTVSCIFLDFILFFNLNTPFNFMFFKILLDFCNFGSKKRNYYRWCDINYVRRQFRYFFSVHSLRLKCALNYGNLYLLLFKNSRRGSWWLLWRCFSNRVPWKCWKSSHMWI